MSLFAGEPERIPLDETSWLEHFPGWLDPDVAASLLANLIVGASDWLGLIREQEVADSNLAIPTTFSIMQCLHTLDFPVAAVRQWRRGA